MNASPADDQRFFFEKMIGTRQVHAPRTGKMYEFNPDIGVLEVTCTENGILRTRRYEIMLKPI